MRVHILKLARHMCDIPIMFAQVVHAFVELLSMVCCLTFTLLQ